MTITLPGSHASINTGHVYPKWTRSEPKWTRSGLKTRSELHENPKWTPTGLKSQTAFFFLFFFSCVGTKAPTAANMPWGYLFSKINSYKIKVARIMEICLYITEELCVIRGSQASLGLWGIERIDLTSTKANKSDLKNREDVP